MTRVIILLLFLGVVVYFGFYVYDAVYDPFKTAYVVDYEEEEYYTCSGYVLREEQVFTNSGDLLKFEKGEGEKVGVGQAVATSYSDRETLEREERIKEIEATLEKLDEISISSENMTGVSKLDEEIKDDIINIALAAANGDAKSLKADSTQLSSLILIRSGTYSGSSYLETLKTSLTSELTQLKSEGKAGTETAIKADRAGVFSGVCDGYETLLSPAMLEEITVADLKKIDQLTVSPDQDAFGKLIFGVKWYYVTTVDTEYIELLKEENSVKMRFLNGSAELLEMEIEKIGNEEDGKCVLILSCDEAMDSVTALRFQTVDLVYAVNSGLRIPKEAVRINEEGVVGVYVIEGLQAEFKPITILDESKDHLIVEKQTSESTGLLAGEEVIVKAKELFDGKVVR